MKPKSPKRGNLLIEDKAKHRKTEIVAAEKARDRNVKKIPIRVDAKTVIFVHPDDFEKEMTRVRLAEAAKPKNEERVNFLKRNNWKMLKNGMWQHQTVYATLDFHGALTAANYFELQKEKISK